MGKKLWVALFSSIFMLVSSSSMFGKEKEPVNSSGNKQESLLEGVPNQLNDWIQHGCTIYLGHIKGFEMQSLPEGKEIFKIDVTVDELLWGHKQKTDLHFEELRPAGSGKIKHGGEYPWAKIMEPRKNMPIFLVTSKYFIEGVYVIEIRNPNDSKLDLIREKLKRRRLK